MHDINMSTHLRDDDVVCCRWWSRDGKLMLISANMYAAVAASARNINAETVAFHAAVN